MPVHLYGRPADMFSLRKIADVHGLFLVEDAAQAHGAEIDGKRTGSLGDVACFSFFPSKNLGAYGDGGAIVTNNNDLAVKCRMIANHGRIKKYDHEFEGINSRLDGLQAAVLSVKLKHIEKWTQMRINAAKKYNRLLKGVGVPFPACPDNIRHVYHLYVIRVKNRANIQKRLQDSGIATGVHYPIALPNLQAYRYLGHNSNDFPVASAYAGEILSLPIFAELTDEKIEFVCDSLSNAIKDKCNG
jgi:dTDP-4-amino-4,6-dideoxygalactose transaminase